MDINERPSWNEYFKELVKVTAKRSPCKRLHVGCIIVKDNRIISQGYNGYLPKCEHKQIIRDGREIATIHAEQNALIDCAKRGVSCLHSDVYITHYPCVNCIKLLCAAEVKNIYYIDDYRNDELVNYFTNISKINLQKLE